MNPVNIAYISSFRELSGDESVGSYVVDSQSNLEYGRRVGTLESLTKSLLDTPLGEIFNLCAVFHDDDESSDFYNLWPSELSVRAGNLHEITNRLPSSDWRKIRSRNHPSNVEKKRLAKRVYENSMALLLDQLEVDILISDSYLCIFDEIMLNRYRGRIINIHPAITRVGDPDRLPGATPTRDAYTRATQGVIIIDDKHAVDIPEGNIIEIDYENQTRKAVQVPINYNTGATVHVVTERVDNGPVILDQRYDLRDKLQRITQEGIRHNNYLIKADLLPTALIEYVSQASVQNAIANARQLRRQAA
jgi:folate-dependent phosphoribosylglycinamide formyltransferase PurN